MPLSITGWIRVDSVQRIIFYVLSMLPTGPASAQQPPLIDGQPLHRYELDHICHFVNGHLVRILSEYLHKTENKLIGIKTPNSVLLQKSIHILITWPIYIERSYFVCYVVTINFGYVFFFFSKFSPYAMGSHNQLPHLHHHSSPSLQTHDSSGARYLWDPSAVSASNFHHPSAHG